jgi:integrase
MRGHIRKHGKGWVVVVDVGHAEDGKRQQRWHTFRTKREAEAGLTEILGKLSRDEYIPPTKVTLGEYLRDVWLPSLADRVEAGGLRATTVQQYRTLAETHVAPNLGGVRLRSLTASMLDKLYGELLRTGRQVRPGKSPAGLSPTTVHAVHVTISAALTHAMRKGVLARNVATMADPPRPRDREQAIWTDEQTTRFMDATKDNRLHALYLLAVTTGMRRGELAGLRWEHIDLDAGKLTVASARVVVGYAVVESGPKTAKGRRTIAIAPGVVEALRAHRRRQLEERLSWGPAWTDTGLVFTREDGTGLHPQYVTWAFQRAAKRAGLPVLPLHALRHGHATAGLRAGVDLHTMSRRLGHSSVAITGDVYSHVVEELDRDAADRTADLLFAPDQQSG